MDATAYACCFCGERVDEYDWATALCWVDPSGAAVIAHYLCTSMFDGLPAWPRPQRWLGRKA